ncbi:MAG: hypothetical protein IKA00_02645 [Prevotella sp.]|nr:hypothetical protein [Prevotella sp.]MBR7170795.1 hypothetical protein [Prevotella sp.]
MEKKYIKPEIQVVEIELQPMMAASEVGVYSDKTNYEDRSKEHTYSFDVWELDEE